MRLIDIENIDYVRLEDSLHCLEHHKGDEVECVICAPTVEAIPKDQYKADMVAVLTDIQLELDEMKITKVRSAGFAPYSKDPFRRGINCSKEIIQQKINSLKENTDGME